MEVDWNSQFAHTHHRYSNEYGDEDRLSVYGKSKMLPIHECAVQRNEVHACIHF